jgi:hypothetical protein
MGRQQVGKDYPAIKKLISPKDFGCNHKKRLGSFRMPVFCISGQAEISSFYPDTAPMQLLNNPLPYSDHQC